MPISVPSVVEATAVRRLLLVKLSSLGDVVHALPLLQALREGLGPDVYIAWAVRSKFAELLTGNPHLSKAFTLQKSGLPDLMAFGGTLRTERFDTALDTQGLLVSGLVTALSGAGRRIGLDSNREGNRLFLTHPVVPGRQRVHIVERLMGFCDTLGLPRPPVRPQVYLAERENKTAKELLYYMENAPIIGCIIGASTPAKTYPVQRWAQVIRHLADCGARPVLLGGPAEKPSAEQIVQSSNGIALTDLTGKTPMPVLGSVMAQCACVIGGDSGPTHLAVAVGTPVVGLYGVTDPVRTGPQWGSAPSIVLDYAEKDAPPETRRPRHPTLNDALYRIPPEVIAEAAQKLLRLTS